MLLLTCKVDLLHLLPTPYPSNCLVIALEVHPLLAIGQKMVLTSPPTAHSASPFHLLDHMILDICRAANYQSTLTVTSDQPQPGTYLYRVSNRHTPGIRTAQVLVDGNYNCGGW